MLVIFSVDPLYVMPKLFICFSHCLIECLDGSDWTGVLEIADSFIWTVHITRTRHFSFFRRAHMHSKLSAAKMNHKLSIPGVEKKCKAFYGSCSGC